MNVKELRAELAKLTPKDDDREIKVWLPGSTIRLNGPAMDSQRHGCFLLEGNLDPGSALGRDD